jgi:hypothetical protein
MKGERKEEKENKLGLNEDKEVIWTSETAED